MLVLALQFSKGRRAGPHIRHFVGRGTPRAVGAAAPCHRRGRGPSWVDSLKTEEKTKLIEPACQEERILRLTCHFD